MLPLVALMSFVMLSFAALTIDLGLAAAQQNRLDSAAEAAALATFREEARLRYRIATEPGLTDEGLGCGQESLDEASGSPLTAREQCIQARARRIGREAMTRVLEVDDGDRQGPPETDVDLGPGAPQLEVSVCTDSSAARCWATKAEQAIPLLFGQASLIPFQQGTLRDALDTREAGSLLPPGATPTTNALRSRGIPIGGVSSAEAHFVVRVGAAQSESWLPGRAPFAVEAGYFAAAADSNDEFELDSDFARSLVEADNGYRVGDDVGASDADPVVDGLPAHYLPLFSPTSSGSDTVIGFTLVRIAAEGSEIDIAPLRFAGSVPLAPGNASASIRTLRGNRDSYERLEIAIAERAGIADIADLLVRAPVLR